MDFRPDLHPRDRVGRWREVLGLPRHRQPDVPAAEVASLRGLRPGQSLVLPHGTKVHRHVTDFAHARDFDVKFDPRSVAAAPDRPGDWATVSSATQLPSRGRLADAIGRLGNGERLTLPGGIVVRSTGGHAADSVSTSYIIDHPGGDDPPVVRGTPDSAAENALLHSRDYLRPPPPASPGRPTPRTEVTMTRADAGAVADAIAALPDSMGGRDDASHGFFAGIGSAGAADERVRLKLRTRTLGVARDATAASDAEAHVRARRALARGQQEVERSPGRPVERSPGRPQIDRSIPRSERIRLAQAGPKPEPVGDIFTAIDMAVAKVRERQAQPRAESPGRPTHNASLGREYADAEAAYREATHGTGDPARAKARLERARAALDDALRRNALRSLTASPGRPAPPVPEGGISIISGGYRNGSYGTWEQAADQLIRDRRDGSKSARAVTGLTARGELDAEQQRYLVELAARRLLAAQEARLRDGEELASALRR